MLGADFTVNCALAVVYSLSRVRLSATVAHPALLPTRFPRQEYWSGFPFPSPGDLPNSGSNPSLLVGRRILYHLTTWDTHNQLHIVIN